MKITETILKRYKETSFVLQLKARFIAYCYLTEFIVISAAIIFTGWANLNNPLTGYVLNFKVLGTLVVGLALTIFGLVLLARGYYMAASHLLLLCGFTIVWVVMIFDHTHVVARLDTIVLVTALLSMTPIVMLDRPIGIVFYGMANIIFLYTFVFLFREVLNLPYASFISYLSDNTVSILAVTAISYQVYSINRRAIEKAEQDISERKKAEEALRESERHYKSLTNNLNIGIFRNTEGPDGKFLEANPAIVKMFGFDNREDFLKIKVADTYKNPYDRKKYTEKLVKEGAVKNEELQLRKKDGTLFIGSVSAVVVKTEENKVKYYDGFIEDVTERKQVEKIQRENEKQLQLTNDLLLKNLSEIKKTKEELKNNEEKYRTLFESANDAIFLMENERFIDCNNKTLEMFDCSKGEIIGQPPYRYSPEKQPDGRDSKLAALEKINAALNIGPQVFEWQHCRTDGSLFNAEVSLTVLYYMGRHHLLAIVRDLTQRKNAEKENSGLQKRLNQAQKMEAIGTLAGGIAHDFNNILSGIFGYSQLAETHIHNPEKAKGHIQQVIKGAQRAAELVHQILTFSRQKETEKHTFKAYLEVKEALKLLRSSIPSTIEIIEKIDSRSMILADPTKIHQIVMNLCTNAYHAMLEKGGTLTISLKDIEISEPKYIDGKNPALGNYLQLEVSDTGHGMDDKTLEKAFDPYFTTKKMGEGTGLGLAIVKAIVEEHDGFLEVTTIPDKGANFYIHFPIIEQESSPKQIKNDMPSVFEGNETIMMVDDEEDIRLSCKEILESYGYRVHCFQNGIDAFKKFEKNPHQFDLIITDMTMPGMTGIELIEKIHDVRQDIPFILCSGFSGLINHEKIMQTVVSKYLMKPLLKSDLASAIRELIDKKSCSKKSDC